MMQSTRHDDYYVLLCGCCRDRQIVLRTLDGDLEIGAPASKDQEGFTKAMEFLRHQAAGAPIAHETRNCARCEGDLNAR